MMTTQAPARPVTAPTQLTLGDAVVQLTLDPAAAAAPQVEAALDVFRKTPGALVQMSGQGAALAIALAYLEGQRGLPGQTELTVSQAVEPLRIDLTRFRHEDVRPRRAALSADPAPAGWIVIDLGVAGGVGAEDRRAQIASALGGDVSLFLSAPAGHLPPDEQGRAEWLAGWVGRLVSLPIGEHGWCSGRVAVCLPGLGAQAVLGVLAVYGLSHSWPTVIRFAPAAPFAVAEAIDLGAAAQRGIAVLRQPTQAELLQAELLEARARADKAERLLTSVREYLATHAQDVDPAHLRRMIDA